ncbi:unnamed protein product [Caenorhabditis angaria]|uniref:Uncharacterized protein n=1 Tax=Caenorhabditis angaria TaxID=860376 RepID=A0A9P1I6D0_9PELO|nr:unnamed protein product [Caenorhabditis angaria]
MASPVPPASAESGLKIAAVELPSTESLERRTRDGKWTLRQLRQTDAIVPLQSGTNQFDSQRGKTGFGMPRNTQTKVEFADRDKQWAIEEQKLQSDSIVRLQSGTNQFESQKGKTGFGMPRNTQTKVEFADHGAARWAITDQTQQHDQFVRLQSGTNQYESQKGMTGFGTPRDVKGKHLKRIWELEFPEEAADFQQVPVNSQQQPQQVQQQ